jgi:hypothetical protein
VNQSSVCYEELSETAIQSLQSSGVNAGEIDDLLGFDDGEADAGNSGQNSRRPVAAGSEPGNLNGFVFNWSIVSEWTRLDSQKDERSPA